MMENTKQKKGSRGLTASLVKSSSGKPGEYSVARVEITPNVKVNSGLAIAAEKEYAGKKARPIFQKAAMIAGSM